MADLLNTAYAAAYTTVRSSLATLAGQVSAAESSRYEQALLALDELHGGMFPAIYPMAGTQADLLLWLEAAAEHMIELGCDGLSIELILADALDH